MDIQIDYQLSSALPEYTSNPHLLARRMGTDVLFQFGPMSFWIIDKLKSS